MATGNFYSMKYDLPLICGWSYEQYAEAYEREYGEEMPDYEYQWEAEDDFRGAKELAENFSRDLEFFDVTVESGYYESFQFYVESRHGDVEDMDNEDTHYYFDLCRSKALRKEASELRKIRRWLMARKAGGYNEVGIVARFSNGETWYNIVA